MGSLLRVCAFCALASVATRVFAAPGPAQDMGAVALTVGPGDGSAVKANADIDAGFSALQSSLQFSLEAAPTTPGADFWRASLAPAASHESAGWKASWTGPDSLHANLVLSDHLDQNWRTSSWGMVDNRQTSIEDRNADLSLSAKPFSAMELTFNGETIDKSVRDIADGVGGQARSALATASQSMRGGLKWSLTPWFSLDASARVGAASMDWRGTPAGGATAGANLAYAAFEPALTGTLATPDKGSLSLTFEHAVSPIDPGAFASYAAVEDRAPGARLTPNREWRYRLSLRQTLAGQLQLSAALTQAHIDSATELGPVGLGLQAPISTGGGQRQTLDLSLSAPLSVIGLPSLTLKGAGAWRDSQVRDPFTGEWRRASAESPRDATLDLVQTAAAGRARWGLQGHFGGAQSLYQMSEVTTINVGDSLGGFVEYDPGAFAVRLQVDGLYGGERTASDQYFAGSRASSYVDRVDRRTEDGQAVRLVLSKAL
jgi:hypothetical protein